MNRRVLAGIFAAITSWQADAQGIFPRDVGQFVTRRDACDHFRGEDPYNEQRRRFLEKNTKKYCVGTDKQLASLKHKYRSDAPVLARLNEYESNIEARAKE